MMSDHKNRETNEVLVSVLPDTEKKRREEKKQTY